MITPIQSLPSLTGVNVLTYLQVVHMSEVLMHVTDKTQVLSGTSMASPIVTGMVANLLSQNVESGKIKSVLIRMAAKNKITKTSLFLRKRLQTESYIMAFKRKSNIMKMINKTKWRK